MSGRIADIYMCGDKEGKQWHLYFSLYIDGVRKAHSTHKIEDYVGECIRTAEYYAQAMRENVIKRYRIKNGFKSHEFTEELTEETGIAGDGVSAFRETLDSLL